MKKVLITGSNGFIGQVLSNTLQENGFEVKKAVRIKTESNQIVLDLTTDWAFNPCDNLDTVFHLAGKAHALSDNRRNTNEYHKINTEGTRKLLEAAQQAGVERFIYFSSVKATGDSELRQDESSERLANTPYGHSKYAAEQLVLKGGYVPHSVVIRPCMVYGNSSKGNLPKMIQSIDRGFFPPLPAVNNHRSMVHVDDVVAATLLMAQTPKAAGQIYIVSDGKGYSSRQLYELICHALDKPVTRITIPCFIFKGLATIGDIIERLLSKRFIFNSDIQHKLFGSAQYSSEKIERELNFKARYTLKQALPSIVGYLHMIK
jgi:nucleoside-diphosphate-sugar epimerase